MITLELFAAAASTHGRPGFRREVDGMELITDSLYPGLQSSGYVYLPRGDTSIGLLLTERVYGELDWVDGEIFGDVGGEVTRYHLGGYARDPWPLFRETYDPPLEIPRFRVGPEGVSQEFFDVVDAAIAAGEDVRFVGNGSDNVYRSGPGNDSLLGMPGADVLRAARGDDELRGGNGGDRLRGGSGEDRLAGGAGKDRLVGGEQADILEGGPRRDVLLGGAARDRLDGGNGRDVLAGGGGRDDLIGGAGRDRFVFRDPAESAPGPRADRILDFRPGEDRIVLRAIDANPATPGDDAFVFIAADGFTGTAGELRFENARLRGDIDGDGVADVVIAVLGMAELESSDFVL